MSMAHLEYGYTQAEIAAAPGLHYASVSRIIKGVESGMLKYKMCFQCLCVESTAPDGTAETFVVASYTDDGGHLNSTGKLHAARELIYVLASIPDLSEIGEANH